jgi:exopolysaccharide biosynthesis polyprenyl glycosylphosphotransferase
MRAFTKRDPFLIFLGDIVILFISLWLMLLIRYRHVPGNERIFDHVAPFSILFIVWLIVFYIAGLYEKRVFIFKQRLPGTIFRAQLINSVIGVLFFYFIPYFGITPKTNLFIYLILSFLLMLGWRIYGASFITSKERQPAILIASGAEMKELRDEVNARDQYNLKFISSVDLNDIAHLDFQEEIVKRIYAEGVELIVVDFNDSKVGPLLVPLYNLIFSKIVFVDMHKVYEDVFDRIPLSLIKYSWFLENISLVPKVLYDILKRIMDIVISLPLAIVSLVFYPFIIFGIKRNDKGPVFITQERIGQNGAQIKTYKFRSMARNETDLSRGADNQITPFGAFMRKTRIDELPQLWNVIRGDLSLIGPRPELPVGVAHYEKEIPYYNIRHLIKPGLSGWAQIYHDNHPHHGFGVEQTKEKLSYDLYYLKNRSFWLDIQIALKTIKKLLSRSGV